MITVNRLVIAAEAVVATAVAVLVWLAVDAAGEALDARGVPPLLAALALFPIFGAATTIAERKHVVSEARRWHGVLVSNLELRVAELASDDEDEGVAEDEEDLYDEGVEAE